MRRIQYSSYGDPMEMRLETFEALTPGKDEVLVRVHAASVNPVDWKLRQGAMKMMTGSKMPRAMGLDFAGVIEQLGSDVSGFQVGDEVFGAVSLKQSGAFADYVVTKEKLIAKKPAALSFEQASTLPVIGDTAWRALIIAGDLKPGQSVFLNGANGGVGQMALAIARSVGASVGGRVGPADMDAAKAKGIDPVLNYQQAIASAPAQKFDVVFDCNGSLTPAEGKALVKSGGKIVDINPTPGKFMRSMISSQRKVVMAKPSAPILQKIAAIAAAGPFPVMITHSVPLNEAIALIVALETGKLKGKGVITMV